MNDVVSPEQRLRQILVFLTILLFFFVSGACALLYQVVWTRKLVLLMGTTSYAVSTLLSVFFMGLGLGSLWGGRLADRSPRPLFLYGVFEIVIGLWAVLFILFIGAGESAAVSLLSHFALSRSMGILIRMVLAALFLIVPATLMGTTLPLLAKFVTTSSQVRGRPIGALYSINTFGAVLGCALAGFVLLPELGYTRTTYVGAIANVAIGLIALALSWRSGAGSIAKETGDGEDAVTASMPRLAVISVFVVIGLCGFCGLALEVLWTRLLAIVFFGTTYAFTTMLTALLCGIAAGSSLATLIVDWVKRRVLFVGVLLVLFGAACIAMLATFERLPDLLLHYQRDLGFEWGALVRVKFMLCFMVLFAPMFLSGMTFPLALKAIAGNRDKLGRDVGVLYGANTFGGVLGALVGGYILIPYLGVQSGIILVGLVLAVSGLWLIVVSPSRGRALKTVLSLLSICLVVGALKAAPEDISRTLNQWFVPEDHEVIYYREGVEGTVLVSEPKEDAAGSDRVLWINAIQATASIEKGVKMNRFQGVLPMLFDRTPRKALFMCLGSGVTCGTLALSDFERIDAVELSKDVLDAVPHFEKDNFKVAENPKVKFHIDDGRNFLLTTKNKYDVITFEPMPLALAGVSTFYTKEYYEQCFAHLTPGGLVSQWVPLHSLRDDLVRSLLRTFTEVFPHYCAWFVNSDVFIVGSNEPLAIDYELARERIERPVIMEGLREVGLGDFHEVLASFMMGQANVDRYVQGYPIMSDDRPWAEFLAPKLVYERNVVPALKAVEPFFESPLPLIRFTGMAEEEAAKLREAIDRRSRAHAHDLQGLMIYYERVNWDHAATLFEESLKIDGDDYNARYYLTEISVVLGRRHIGWEDYDKALEVLLDAVRYTPARGEAHLLLGDVYTMMGRRAKARESYGTYLELGGKSARASERVGASSGG